ncbi:hypothetical protein CUZ56_01198 [Saezia sanguinis]|uniref:Uncharacterized protein n=1 Tax=Saezia sanguinis TaxID=1965230 RepID=A0A433SEV1_9BURK|nr:hypothetical protein CUZ56_01198 [Saezia sanguinis]
MYAKVANLAVLAAMQGLKIEYSGYAHAGTL